MITSPGTKAASSPYILLLVCLVMLLTLLFRQSFADGQSLFANDAPLGQLKTQEGKGLGNFRGVWIDLNWLGSTQPSALPNVSNGLYLATNPEGYAKFYAPVALLLLGLSAGLFFRQLGFGHMAVVLGACAALLNTDPFSYACWGLPSLTLTMASTFAALAALTAHPGKFLWLKLALGGLAVGFSITEGFDNGAISSLYVAAFVGFQTWTESKGSAAQKLVQSALRISVVAVFAALMAAQALSTLIGTQVKGIVGTQQDSQSKQLNWDKATMWSLPKIETLRVIIPGLFGYRMDTPDGGNYWGAVGQQPGVPQTRHSGSGVYAGVLVALIAGWAVARAAAKQHNPFTDRERKYIGFWTVMAVVSLLLAFGRHASFYQFLYALPYFSTIRNPIKFMHPFTICIVTLFAYGLQGLTRQYLEKNLLKSGSLTGQLKSWWASATSFEKRWTFASLSVVALGLLGWLLLTSSQRELLRHLESAGFPAQFATSIARFATGEVGWFVLFAALSAAVVLLITSGALSGARAGWAGFALGLVLLADMGRANSPWIIYYDYREKYASNPVVNLLAKDAHEHRVAGRLSPLTASYLAQGRDFPEIYNEWMQHHFPYYGVQCLDIIQMPRIPELDDAYLRALMPQGGSNLFPIARLWQLTNTRYQLGMTPYLDLLNQQVDPINRAFRIATNFDFAPRSASVTAANLRLEDLTAVLNSKGQHAIFELTNALSRAKLFTAWETKVPDQAVLARLADPKFDPTQTVLVSDDAPAPTPGVTGSFESGTAQITSYESKKVLIRTKATTAAMLLLNDKFHPDWKVFVDGQPARLLRANFIMRGVHLPPGEHAVEFRFEPSISLLYVSLAALVLGLGLAGVLAFAPKEFSTSTTLKNV
ncbi:MAG: hypothetical protein EXS31_09785 [Pedosphaera sp.]|nr:hypothetical protein [Pedosphaera sp.]